MYLVLSALSEGANPKHQDMVTRSAEKTAWKEYSSGGMLGIAKLRGTLKALAVEC